jgi:hypothetical protein
MGYPNVAMRRRPSSVLGTILVVGACCLGGCSSSNAAASGGKTDDVSVVRHVDRVTLPPSMPLAGARCKDGHCACRAAEDEPEKRPPAEGQKRLEIRMSADGGDALLDAPGLGRLTSSGPQEACFYLDVPAGGTQSFTFTVVADRADRGVGPHLAVTEYGPAGPYWYRTLAITCAGANARCDRNGADAWGRGLATRKRGRLDPCGSMVVTGLKWETSGSEAERNGGFFRDFIVRFDVEAKKFATKFAPGSTECVPK